MKTLFIISVMTIALGLFKKNMMTQNTRDYTIPVQIKNEVEIAMSHYLDLKKANIEFVIKPSLKKSFMKSQPVFSSLLHTVKNRKYRIYISNKFTVEDKTMYLDEIPKKILIGWLGHELGHVMDYKNRSSLNLIGFGICYIFSGKYIREAERSADSYAVSHGMGDYILATKNFILNHADFSERYKQRIKRLYVSPDEILELVKEKKRIDKLN